MITKKFKDLREVDIMVAQLFAEDSNLEHSKFGYGYKRFSRKILSPIFKDYRDALLDVRIESALVDPNTKAVITTRNNDRGFEYDKEGLKKVVKAEREVIKEWETKEFEIEPLVLTEENMPEGITEDQKELLMEVIAA